MRLNSIVMLILAFVFGTGAVFLTKIYLNNERASLISPVTAKLSPTATIIVAAKPLRFGDQLQIDNLRKIPWPSGNIPAGAFSTKDELLEAGERFVLSAVEPNEPVLQWKITGPGQRATLSALLDEGMKAITIRVNDVLGVAGFVLPGDRVDILLTRKSFVDVLLQGVKVLAIDQRADDRSDAPAVVKAVTLEVSTEQAQKLTLATEVGTLSLALRNVAQGTQEKTERIGLKDLDEDGPSVLPPPPEIESEPVIAGPARARFSTIGVIRATKRSEYQVKKGD